MVTGQEFAAAMMALGPFEPAPRIAAGVSGGADSMALALLADAWARERGGSLLALVADHGLRAESGTEAAAAAARLGALGIAVTLLEIKGSPAARALPSGHARHGSPCSRLPAPAREFCICCLGTMRVTRPRRC